MWQLKQLPPIVLQSPPRNCSVRGTAPSSSFSVARRATASASTTTASVVSSNGTFLGENREKTNIICGGRRGRATVAAAMGGSGNNRGTAQSSSFFTPLTYNTIRTAKIRTRATTVIFFLRPTVKYGAHQKNEAGPGVLNIICGMWKYVGVSLLLTSNTVHSGDFKSGATCTLFDDVITPHLFSRYYPMTIRLASYGRVKRGLRSKPS